MLWAVINASNISLGLTRMIDANNFDGAKNAKFYLDNFINKLKSLCQSYGGSAHLLLYERMILELPIEAAELLPNVVENYMPNLSKKIGVGIGMNFEEANLAAQKSLQTHKIELYEKEEAPLNYVKTEVIKNSSNELPFDFPPNIFDPELPDSKNITRIETGGKRPQNDGQYRLDLIKPDKVVVKPSAKEDALSQKKLIDHILDEVKFPKEKIEQQIATMQQQAEQIKIQQQQEQQQAQQQAQQQEVNQKEELEEIPEKDEHDSVSEKLLGFLGNLKNQMPELMRLHESNPEAFKHIMSLVNKMLKLSKQKIQKNDQSITEKLEKKIRKKIKRAKGSKLPVGTLKGRKIKVLSNGREVWRSVSSGLVRDTLDNPISVKSRNLETD
jgi:hypothetical protein